MVDLTNRTKVIGFPKSSDDYDKWIASGREFVSGQWYEPIVAPSPSPIEAPEHIEKGVREAEQTFAEIQERIAREGITDAAGNVLQAPADLEKDVFGEDDVDLGTSDIARDEEDGTQAKIDAAEQMQKDQDEISKLTTQQQLEDVRTQLGLDPKTGLERPAVPTYESDFEALRAEEGVTAIETQMNTLDEQIRDTEASLRQGLYDEEGKLRPMELIGTRQRELKRQGQEELDVLNRRKQTLVDELNTKNTLISNIMSLKQADYNAAASSYNSQFSQSIQLLNLMEGRTDRVDQEANRQRDDARANLTVLQNLYRDVEWSQVDTAARTQINQLEMKAGLPTGVTEAFMKSNPDTEVNYTATGYDAQGNQTVSFFSYNDGDPQLIKSITTGAVKPGTGEQFISRDWFISEFTEKALADKAIDEGIGHWWESAEVRMNKYLEEIMKGVETRRGMGMTDEQIAKEMKP